MKIRGGEDLSETQITNELRTGSKLIVYQYCISVGIMTFNRRSAIYLIKNDESTLIKGLKYSLISFIFGWWGVPFGPIYTVSSISTNFKGGNDVTWETPRYLFNK